MAKKSNGFDYINFALSFGLTLVITTYLLYLGGSWLDGWLGTEPLFMMLGVILAIATIFRQLIVEVQEMAKDKQEDSKEDENEE